MVNYKSILIIIFIVLGNYTLNDVLEAFEFYASKISPTHPVIAQALLIILFIFILFSEELIKLYQKLSNSIKFKERF